MPGRENALPSDLEIKELSEICCTLNTSVKNRSRRRAALWALWLAFAFCMTTASPAKARGAAIHPVADIKATAVAFVTRAAGDKEEVHTQVLALDRRLRMTRCDVPLTGFWPPAARRHGVSSVGVRCEGQRRWKMFVPVRIAWRKVVMIATRALRRGDQLRQGDLVAQKRDVSGVRFNFLTPSEEYVGHRLARGVSAGAILNRNALLRPKLVSRGQKVSVAVGGRNWQIVMDGIALDDGGLGSLVRIRNAKTRRVVRGEVIAPARVRVPF